jgi:hypothetical protein
MKSRSPAGPWRRDWPNSGSEKSKKPTLKLLVLRMKHVAKLEDLTRSSESAGKDSEDSRLPMLKGGQNPEGPHVRLVDLMSRRDFGQGKDKRMAMGMKMKDTGLIGAQVEASRLITVGEKFLGGHLFDRIRCRSVVVFSERFATFRRSFFLLRFWRLSYYVSAQHPSSPNCILCICIRCIRLISANSQNNVQVSSCASSIVNITPRIFERIHTRNATCGCQDRPK